MTGWLTLLLHAALVAATAPLLAGFLAQLAACQARRPPPPLLQPWRDLVRQWRKPPLRPAGTSFLVAIAPPVACAAAAAAALLVPSFTLGMATAGGADLLVVAGLLAMSRLVPALAAVDAAAARPGDSVPAARLRAEPILLLAALVAAMLAGSTNLDAGALRDSLAGTRIPAALAGLALLAIAGEPAAPAVFSGRDLALITAAAQARCAAGLSLAAVIGLPLGLAAPGAGPDAWLTGAALWLLKLGLLGTLAAALAAHRAVLPAAALLALIAAVVAGIQGTA